MRHNVCECVCTADTLDVQLLRGRFALQAPLGLSLPVSCCRGLDAALLSQLAASLAIIPTRLQCLCGRANAALGRSSYVSNHCCGAVWADKKTLIGP